MKKCLFVGLATLDFIYLVEKFPQQNQKIVALEDEIAAGGPATNAAITYKHLGNQANLVTVIGNHPLANLIKADLTACGVNILDLEPDRSTSPPVSSIIVTQNTGDRAVVSLNAVKSQAPLARLPSGILAGIDIILIDGHQIIISEAIAKQAKKLDIPVVMDGGSWKKGADKILPYTDYAICSANFLPPNCNGTEDAIAYLKNLGIENIAITQGEKPILYLKDGKRGEITLKNIAPVDTLGAGDIFHGAFCHFILEEDFVGALARASEIASASCEFFGTRKMFKRCH